MCALVNLHLDLQSVMAELDAVLEHYSYGAKATLLLRHPDGPSKSILLSNCTTPEIVECILSLSEET